MARGIKSKADKLADYKRIREGGGRSKQWKDSTDDTLYDEVSEDEYRQVVKGRLERDDFVVDDGVEGYADNGMDDWDQEPASSEDEGARKKTTSKKKAKTVKPTKPVPPPTMAAYRPAVSAVKEEDFLASILGNINNATATAPRGDLLPRKRKPEPYARSSSPDATSFGESSFTHGFSSDGMDFSDIDDAPAKSTKRQRTSPDAAAPTAERLGKLQVVSEPEEDEFDRFFDDHPMDFDAPAAEFPKTGIKAEIEEPALNGILRLETEKETLVAEPAWMSIHASLKIAKDDEGTLEAVALNKAGQHAKVLEDDGSVNLFWFDYFELEGNVHLVGKVRDKESGSWVSCCVTVGGIQRNIFVLPREQRLDMGVDSGEAPTDDEVQSEFTRIRRSAGIRSCGMKWVTRNYAFEDRDVPVGGSRWLKVVYGFDQPQIEDKTSSSISKIMGTNTSAFELLVVKRKIMGPCWLRISGVTPPSKAHTWCKVEYTVDTPKNVSPFQDGVSQDLPPLSMMSISMRSVVNHKHNKREVVCISTRSWQDLNIDDAVSPEELPCTVHTFVRPIEAFPKNFEAEARKRSGSHIVPMPSERALLNGFLATIQRADPDIVIGHDFLGVELDPLLHRLKELEVDNWSRIGRFRRAKFQVGRPGTNSRSLAGRLLCDLTSDMGKSSIASTTWSLTEMCNSVLGTERQDIDPDDTASYFDSAVSSPVRLLTFVRHCELDAHFHVAIASKVQILPLTKQLTNIAGNSWSKTLVGGRAERNEFILLHEFHRLKYICPDKFWQKKGKAANENETGEVKGPTKSKRDKYKGGLVFEPKRGLWDKYILVMDFNSLYPSIIQEYNIDFTTVDRSSLDEDAIPEPPSSEVAQGVLPRLIATLVNRRRQVKGLMKDKNVSPAKMAQYEIKQQALKLTANSMYGCLGFEGSRFYAKPLAALTTFKGREILQHTRELAENAKLDVVYGDTDSVFVNSNATDLAGALKVAEQFKKEVNDRYRLLEIDLDGVFQRLLLLQKKKYAAIKVEDGSRTSIEIKGLDMKRREYCALSKRTSAYVLQQILSGELTEVVVERIHEYLTALGTDVREGKMHLEDFIVFKRLGKRPEDYPDAKSQPHVQVALRLKAKGGTSKAGDVIPYIFCMGEDGTSAKTAQADRAYHPDELRKAGSELKIDFEHYLTQQILPPIERLCDSIEGTDRARLAECLGLDPARFRVATSSSTEERPFGSLESQIPDSERFKDAQPYTVKCRHCNAEFAFKSVADFKATTTSVACPNQECGTELELPSLEVQLVMQIRRYIAQYYEGWVTCDDPTCEHRTRMMSVYGKRCLRTGCRGSVSFEYNDLQLYNQLMSFAHLFDEEKILNNARGRANYTELQTQVKMQGEFLRYMNNIVQGFLQHCGRRWVELDTLFSFMRL